MKISDIIALAKQGYTPGDIRDLLALAKEVESTEVDQAAEAPEAAPAQVTEPAAEDAPGEDEKPAPVPDQNTERINELENKIKGLQAENTRRPRPEDPPKKSDAEILADMARRFM